MARRSKLEMVDVEALCVALAAAELRADQATSRSDQAVLRADEAQAAVERAKAEAAAVKARHGDDTTVRVLAKGKTSTGPVWVHGRDDLPFGGADPPAAPFHFSPDCRDEHPQAHLANWTGVLRADAYGGFGKPYGGGRKPAPIIEAACWAHARRKFFELFAIEREVNGRPAAERLAVRRERSAPIVAALEGWMRAERARLPGAAPVAKAMNCMLERWPSFARFLDDGRVGTSNNAPERALRGLALGRKAWLFAGSNRGGRRAAFFDGLIVTAKPIDVDFQAWLADVLGRIASHPAQRLGELPPWDWRPIPAETPSLDAAA